MSDRITAAQAREISGSLDEQEIAAAIDDAMTEIKYAAESKSNVARLRSHFWARGGYKPEKGDMYSRACEELRKLGYTVHFFYEERQFVDMYTVVGVVIMTDKLQQVLDTPGCERLKDFASVGPAQRAALELFVDRIRAAEPEEHAQSLVAEIKRLKQRAAPMTEEEILVRFDEIVNARAHDSKVIAFARVIEARKARP